jgi:hypothetical protein
LGYPAAAKTADECEAYGRKVFCYPCFASIEQRRKAEDELEARGFKVERKYGMLHDRSPGRCAEVAVSYFKARHWDE